jgi:hypothetical protein
MKEEMLARLVAHSCMGEEWAVALVVLLAALLAD